MQQLFGYRTNEHREEEFAFDLTQSTSLYARYHNPERHHIAYIHASLVSL